MIASAAAIATSADPVAFRRMDDPDADVAVRLVVMLALADASSPIPVLRELTGMLQNAPLAERYLVAGQKERFAILNEIARLEPVVGHLYRRAGEPIEVAEDGQRWTIPEGSLVDL